MPKETKLKKEFEMRASGSTSKKFRKYKFELKWEGQSLRYKHVTWKKIDLAETLSWDVTQEQAGSKGIKRRRQERKIVTLKVWSKKQKKAIEWKLKIPGNDLDTWFYWLLVSIVKHSNCSIEDEKLDGLKLSSPKAKSRKGKIRARRDMAAFDAFHRVFITASDRFEKGKMLPAKGPMAHAQVAFTGEGGFRFGSLIKLIGQGGEGQVFELTRRRPAHGMEPAVIKTTETLDNYGVEVHSKAKGLIREARILAALGEHPNIIRLIDALATRKQIYLFLEMGEEDLTGKAKRVGKMSSKQIRKIALGILAGLSHMHKRRIYHMDVKPDNVLMFKHDTPKIMDFGKARTKMLDPEKEIYVYEGDGSDGWKPPECVLPDTWPDCFAKQIDLERYDGYATGLVILRTLIGPRYGWKYEAAKRPTDSELFNRAKKKAMARGLKKLTQQYHKARDDSFRALKKTRKEKYGDSEELTKVQKTMDEEIYWTNMVITNSARLRKDLLHNLALHAIQMIQEKSTDRLTVRQAYAGLKKGRADFRKGRMKEGSEALKHMQEQVQKMQEIGKHKPKTWRKSI